MNKGKSKNKLVITLMVVVVLALIYFFFMGGSAPQTGLLQSGPASDPVSSQVIVLLNQIQSLRIDAGLFSDPAYQTLRDNTVPIVPQNVGRPNPFAPVPGMPTLESQSSRR